MEIRRIFTGGFVAIIFAIIAITALLFYKEQLDENTEFLNSKKNDANYAGCSYDGFDLYQKYSEYIAYLKQYEPSEWRDAFKEYNWVKKEDDLNAYCLQREARSMANKKITYALEYRSNIEDVIKRSEDYVSISIYANTESYSYHNILKTRYDMKKLLDVEVTVTNDKAYEAVYSYEFLMYAMIIIIFMLVYAFYAERKKGLWNCVYATPKGRLSITLKRAAIMLGTIMVTLSVMYVVLFWVSFGLYGGADSLFDSIQSTTAFEYCMLKANKLSYTFILIIMQSFGLYAVGLIMWAISSKISQLNLSLIVIGFIGVVEFILFNKVSVNSTISFLKYINIFTYMSPHYILSTYMNMGKDTNIYNRMHVYIWSLLVFVVVFCLLAVLINTFLRPIRNVGLLERILQKISAFFRRIMASMNVFLKELYKILILQKGIIVIALVIMLALDAGNVVGFNHNESTIIVKDYIDTPDEEKVDEYNKLKGAIEDIKSQYEETTDINKKERLQKALQSYSKAVEVIDEYIVYANEMKEKGYDVDYVEQYVYDEIFGKKLYKFTDEYSLLCILLVIGISYNIFDFEKKSKVISMLRTTKTGRVKTIISKYAVTFLISLIVVSVINVLDFKNIKEVYELKHLDFSIQSIMLMKKFPINMSFKSFLTLLVIYRVIITWMIANILTYLSLKIGAKGTLVVGIAALIPYILTAFNINILKFVSIPRYISFIELYNAYGNGLATFLPLIIIVTAGSICMISNCRKWMKGVMK